MASKKDDIYLELWEKYRVQINKIAAYKLRSCPDETEDVVSDVFLALYEKISSGDVPNKPKEWLYVTLNNKINMKYREIYKDKEFTQSLYDKKVEIPYEYDLIDRKINEIYTKELKEYIDENLNNEEKDLIFLIYTKRLKMKEIAKLKNSTESAIKQKHYRLCNKIRKIVHNYEK